MKALQDHGVTVQGMRVTITDRARLAAVAVPDPLIDGPVVKAATTAFAQRSGSACVLACREFVQGNVGLPRSSHHPLHEWEADLRHSAGASVYSMLAKVTAQANSAI